jgi:hypothetical protein
MEVTDLNNNISINFDITLDFFGDIDVDIAEINFREKYKMTNFITALKYCDDAKILASKIKVLSLVTEEKPFCTCALCKTNNIYSHKDVNFNCNNFNVLFSKLKNLLCIIYRNVHKNEIMYQVHKYRFGCQYTKNDIEKIINADYNIFI